jgi:polar amino acid transport system substrate-binding protein
MSRLALGLLAALTLGACVPPSEGYRRFESDTPMGAIQDRGVLVVGVEMDSPPFGSMGEDGHAVGFTVDIARQIADELRVDLQLLPAPSDQLFNLLDSEVADLAFPVVSVSEELARAYSPTDPYWEAHQRLLVPRGSDIDSFEDLGGKKVCAVLQPFVGVDPELVAPGTDATEGDEAACLARLRSGSVDAVTAADHTLIEMKSLAPTFDIVGENVTVEGVAGFTLPRYAALTDLVDRVLVEADEGAWAKSYRRWITPIVGGQVPDPPVMTAEEASALFPTPR